MTVRRGQRGKRKRAIKFEGGQLFQRDRGILNSSLVANNCKTIFCSGFPRPISKSVLTALFSKMTGSLVEAVRYNGTGHFCHVRLLSPSQVVKCLLFNGWWIKLSSSGKIGKLTIDSAQSFHDL